MVNKQNKVRHVAIIMDGNGRWAAEKGLERIEGHKNGADAVKRTIEAAKDFGVEYLTLYAFSTENWKRPKEEVDALMGLLESFIDENIDEIDEKGIRIKASGRLWQLPDSTRKKLLDAIEKTKNNDKGTVILAISYGGRSEIVDASKKIAEDAINGKLDINELDETLFRSYLYVPDVPDPELMIRTSGEFRLSNFLLWQLSYSEIYISDLMWPDFDKDEFEKALNSFGKRERRFGRSE